MDCFVSCIYYMLANVYGEMTDYEKALKPNKINYFIEQKHAFWDMYIFKHKLNPFVKDDKYFYCCNRIFLNTIVLYEITEILGHIEVNDNPFCLIDKIERFLVVKLFRDSQINIRNTMCYVLMLS